MDCESFRNHSLEFSSEVLTEEQSHSIEAHRLGCPSCAREASDLKDAWKSMEALPTTATPYALRSGTLDRIQDLMEEGPADAQGLNLGQLVVALLSGSALASLGLLSLNRQLDLGSIPLSYIAAATTWWVVLFALVVSLIIGRYRYGGLRLRRVASIGAAGAGIILACNYVCPQVELVSFWRSSLLGELITNVLGADVSPLVFGGLYAMIPTLLVSLYFGHGRGPQWVMHAVSASGVFLLLMLPSFYIQCCSIQFTFAVLMTVGMALGSLGGTLSGLGIRHWRGSYA